MYTHKIIDTNTVVSTNGQQELTIKNGLMVKKVIFETDELPQQVWEYLYDEKGNLTTELLDGYEVNYQLKLDMFLNNTATTI